MKKILSLSLCLALLVALTACGGNGNNTPDTTPPSTENTIVASQSTEYIPYEESLVAVSMPKTNEEHLADDGTCIFVFTNQDMTLTMDDGTVADAITADFLAKNDFSSAAQEVLNAAKAAYSQQEDWSYYFYELYYSPVRLDSQLLSLYGSEVIYNGSPRSITTNVSLTYDLLTGKALTLKDILVNNYSVEDLIALIVDAVKEYSEQGILFTDYEYIISDLFSTNVQMDRWYFSDNGLCFFFTPYEIAPNIAGTVTAEIPYGALTGLLKNEYFPPESIPYTGTVRVTPFVTDDQLENYEFTEIILSSEVAGRIIAAEGTVLNVRLYVGDWTDSEFQPNYTVYAATAITQGQAIFLQEAEANLENLAISYDGIQTQPIKPIEYGAS